MFQAAHAWGVSPSEFWGMTIPEWFALYDMHRTRDAKNDYAGNLVQADVDELAEFLGNR